MTWSFAHKQCTNCRLEHANYSLMWLRFQGSILKYSFYLVLQCKDRGEIQVKKHQHGVGKKKHQMKLNWIMSLFYVCVSSFVQNPTLCTSAPTFLPPGSFSSSWLMRNPELLRGTLSSLDVPTLAGNETGAGGAAWGRRGGVGGVDPVRGGGQPRVCQNTSNWQPPSSQGRQDAQWHTGMRPDPLLTPPPPTTKSSALRALFITISVLAILFLSAAIVLCGWQDSQASENDMDLAKKKKKKWQRGWNWSCFLCIHLSSCIYHHVYHNNSSYHSGGTNSMMSASSKMHAQTLPPLVLPLFLPESTRVPVKNEFLVCEAANSCLDATQQKAPKWLPLSGVYFLRRTASQTSLSANHRLGGFEYYVHCLTRILEFSVIIFCKIKTKHRKW